MNNYHSNFNAMDITVELVKSLIASQFPQFQSLDIYPVEKSGHDNRTFHLGDNMTVRLPSGEGYAVQVEKESKWLPYLSRHLDFPISKPLYMGEPDCVYPYPWSIITWIPGETLFECTVLDRKELAAELAEALKKLQSVDCTGGPHGALYNYYRGCALKIYHKQTMDALEQLSGRLPTQKLLSIWMKCISKEYEGQDVWVHGDIAPGNILVMNGKFYGLIDFGVLGTGDPACDYAMAWTYFSPEERKYFLKGLPEDMIDRARGWALWKALITYDDENTDFKTNAHSTIDEILKESEERNR